jgi:hypothetical protein
LFVKIIGDNLSEQRINIKFIVNLEKNVSDIYKILQKGHRYKTHKSPMEKSRDSKNERCVKSEIIPC